MAFIQEELGRPWYDIFEELSPEPIAAGQPPGGQRSELMFLIYLQMTWTSDRYHSPPFLPYPELQN